MRVLMKRSPGRSAAVWAAACSLAAGTLVAAGVMGASAATGAPSTAAAPAARDRGGGRAGVPGDVHGEQ